MGNSLKFTKITIQIKTNYGYTFSHWFNRKYKKYILPLCLLEQWCEQNHRTRRLRQFQSACELDAVPQGDLEHLFVLTCKYSYLNLHIYNLSVSNTPGNVLTKSITTEECDCQNYIKLYLVDSISRWLRKQLQFIGSLIASLEHIIAKTMTNHIIPILVGYQMSLLIDYLCLWSHVQIVDSDKSRISLLKSYLFTIFHTIR